MQKIVPCLWFDKEAEDAIKFYIEIFNSAPKSSKNSVIVSIQRYPEEPSNIPVKGMEGEILTAIFELQWAAFYGA